MVREFQENGGLAAPCTGLCPNFTNQSINPGKWVETGPASVIVTSSLTLFTTYSRISIMLLGGENYAPDIIALIISSFKELLL